ncbi:Uncharacterised protein [Serratia rubidaea]|uniref:Uncharacterized protein n=1 Tax=Serratia rubidaea TaxID=61652 RepID=A0A447QTL4_SERRU|nr:Uncharacterised protein [Serratia rubidaea]
MDIKNLLHAINELTEQLKAANRIIAICDSGFHKGLIYAYPEYGAECRLYVGEEIIREVAINEKQKYEAELAVLCDAKKTAERVIAGLLPDNNISA